MAGVPGFEPGHDGIKIRCLTAWLYPKHFIKMVEGDGFEPPNPKERIYSPPRLATSLPLQGMVPAKGVEPSTYWLQVSCSTNWATPANIWWRMTGSNRRPPACKAGALPAELILHDLVKCYKLFCFINGDPYGIRTRVTAVKGRCLNHLTNGPIR